MSRERRGWDRADLRHADGYALHLKGNLLAAAASGAAN